MIKGKKVSLRPLEKEDIYKIVEWRNQEGVRTNFLDSGLLSKYAQEAWYEQYQKHFQQYQKYNDRLIFAIEAENQYIGITWLYDINHRNQNATIGMLIGDKNFWGKGYGTDAIWALTRYAFDEMNLRRINGYIVEYNKGSLRMVEKNGYKVEGCMRKAYYAHSQFWDVKVVGILKEEFEQ